MNKELSCGTKVIKTGDTCGCSTFMLHVIKTQVCFTCTLHNHRGFIIEGEVFYESEKIEKRG